MRRLIQYLSSQFALVDFESHKLISESVYQYKLTTYRPITKKSEHRKLPVKIATSSYLENEIDHLKFDICYSDMINSFVNHNKLFSIFVK